MNICKKLPFIYEKFNDISNFPYKEYNLLKEELYDFILYFNIIWIKYFKSNAFNLNDISIKFRTNNFLERFNSILKEYAGKKGNINLIKFIDILIDEINEHEDILIKDNKSSLKLASKTYLKNDYIQSKLYDNKLDHSDNTHNEINEQFHLDNILLDNNTINYEKIFRNDIDIPL